MITGLVVSDVQADTFVASVAFVPNGAGGKNLFAGIISSDAYASYGGVYVSSNGGGSWSAADSGIASIVPDFYYSTTALAAAGSNVFAGTYGGGLYLSTNQGALWTKVMEGMTNETDIADLYVYKDTIYAATPTNVYKRPLSEMVTAVQQKGPNVPATFSLLQNYPNPFNPTTVISYQLPVTGQVTLEVYDMLGREIATLVNDRENAGSYSVKFDGSKLASGVYFYRIVADNYVATRKMALLK